MTGVLMSVCVCVYARVVVRRCVCVVFERMTLSHERHKSGKAAAAHAISLFCFFQSFSLQKLQRVFFLIVFFLIVFFLNCFFLNCFFLNCFFLNCFFLIFIFFLLSRNYNEGFGLKKLTAAWAEGKDKDGNDIAADEADS